MFIPSQVLPGGPAGPRPRYCRRKSDKTKDTIWPLISWMYRSAM
ncbi:hypothetical protein L810_1519 [Burkholderia sp. AU4i]|nr:hypothetical protein L810_1519 [Burkholderia sp. AU4i]